MTGLLVATVTAVAWASFDVVRKAITRHVDPAAVVLLVTLPQTLFFGARWAFDGAPMPNPSWWVPLIVSTGLNLAANLLFLQALHRGGIARVIPLLSLSPVFTAVTGYLVLGEAMTTTQSIGIALVVVGCLLTNPASAGLRAWLRALGADPGTWRTVVVALCWGVTPAFDKLGVEAAGLDLHAAAPALGIFLVVLARLRHPWRRLQGARSAPGILIVTVALGPISMGLQLFALTLVPVAILESVKRVVGMTSSLFVGRILFREQVGSAQVIGVVAMAIGLPLILGI